MNIDIIRLWVPNIVKKTRYVYVARYCPFCREGAHSEGNIFRVNLKLKIFKCYNCGTGGKTIQDFAWKLKKLNEMGYIPERRKCLLTGRVFRHKVGDIEVQKGCDEEYESLLPF